MAELHFESTLDNSNFTARLREIQSGVSATARQIESSGMSMEDVFSRLSKAAAGFGMAFSAKEFVGQVLQVRGEFQQLEVAFDTMLGSKERATQLMGDITKLAATTPFNLQDVAGGAKQLLAYGESAEKVTDTMRRLGDIAAGLGLNLKDLTWLYGTTMVQGRLYAQDLNQFTGRGIPLIQELAKQFGVTQDKVKDLVSEGKVGFPQVQKAIMDLTSEGGRFNNLMAEQSKTITGQISNIQDAFDGMLNKIGQSSEGIINDALAGVSWAIENYETLGKQIMELVVAYGAYKAVLMSVAAYQGAVTTVSYATEIAELSRLIPQKQASANADIQQAVASGNLSAAKAEQVSAIRAEIAAKRQELQATLSSAEAETAAAQAVYKSSLQRSIASREAFAARQQELIASREIIGSWQSENAAKEMGRLADERAAAAKAKKVAAQNLEIAKSKENVAATALDTFNTNVNTATNTVNAKSTNILTIAKTRLAAASKALGLSMLANPYVLVAAAIGGLVYALIKARDITEENKKAQKEYNAALNVGARVQDTLKTARDEATRSTQTEITKLKSLYDITQDTTKSMKERLSAVNQLKKAYPDYFGKLSNEAILAGKAANEYKRLTENIIKSAMARGIKKQIENLADESAQLQKAVNADTNWTRRNRAEYNRRINNINRQQSGNPSANIDGSDIAARAYQRNSDFIITETNRRNRALAKNTKLLAANKKTISGLVSIYNKQYSQFGSLFGDTDDGGKTDYSSTSSTGGKKDKKNKERVKTVKDSAAELSKAYREALGDFLNAAKEADSKTSDELSELELSMVKDPSAKTLLQIARDGEEKRKAIREEAGKTGVALAKADFASWRSRNPKGTYKQYAAEGQKKYGQDFGSKEYWTGMVSNPKADLSPLRNNESLYKQTLLLQNDFSARYEANERAQQLKREKLREDELKDMDAYLQQYGSYQERRLAVARDYDRQIAEASTEGRRKTLQAQKNDKLREMDFEQFKVSIDWEEVFGNLDSLSSAALKRLRGQLARYLNEAGKSLRPEDLKTLTEAIGKIDLSSAGKNPFAAIGQSLNEYRKAAVEAENAQRDLDTVTSGGTVVTRVYTDSQGKLRSETLSVAEAVGRLIKAQQKQEKAQQKLATGTDKLMSGLKTVGQTLSTVAGNLGADGMAEGINTALSSVESLYGAFKSFKAGGFENILSGVSSVAGIIASGIGNAIKVNKENRRVLRQLAQERIDQQREYNKLLMEQNLLYKEGTTIFGTDSYGKAVHSISVMKKAQTDLNASIQGTREQQEKWANAASPQFQGGGIKEYMDWRKATLNGDTYSKLKADYSGLADVKVKDGSYTTGILWWKKRHDIYKSVLDLYPNLIDSEGKLDQTVAESIMNTREMDDTSKKALQNMIDLAKQSEEAWKEVTDYLTNIFGQLGTDIVDIMTQASQGGADAFQKMTDSVSDMLSTLAKQMAYSIFLQPLFEKMQTEVEDIMKNKGENATFEDYLNVFDKYTSQLEGKASDAENFLKEADKRANEKGYDLFQDEDEKASQENQTATAGGWESMGQDTAEELNGRFTALQVAGESAASSLTLAVQQLQGMAAVSVATGSSVSEIRNILLSANSYWEDIARYAKKTYNDFGLKLDSIAKNTKRI